MKTPDEMIMPSECICGQWFELNDGYKTLTPNHYLVCKECHKKEIQRRELEWDIEDEEPENTEEIKRLQNELEELGGTI